MPSYYASVVSVALAAALGLRLHGARTGRRAGRAAGGVTLRGAVRHHGFHRRLLTAAGLWALWAAAGGRWKTAAVALALAFAIKQTALLYALLAQQLPRPRGGRRRGRWRGCRAAAGGAGADSWAVFAWDAARHPAIGFWTQGYADNMPGRWVRANEVGPRARAWLDLLVHDGVARAVWCSARLAAAAGGAGSVDHPRGAGGPGRRRAFWHLLGAYWLLAFNVWIAICCRCCRWRCCCWRGWWWWRRTGSCKQWRVGGPTWRAPRRWVTAGVAVALGLATVSPAWRRRSHATPLAATTAHDGLTGWRRMRRRCPKAPCYTTIGSVGSGGSTYGGPVYVAWLPTPAALATDLRAFGRSRPATWQCPPGSPRPSGGRRRPQAGL